jgi:hypothetical protein
LPSIHK